MFASTHRDRTSPTESRKDLVYHECWPEERLEEGSKILPERVCLLPEVHQGPEYPEAIDRPAACRTCAV